MPERSGTTPKPMKFITQLALTTVGTVAMLGTIAAVGAAFHTPEPLSQASPQTPAVVAPSEPTEAMKLAKLGWQELKPGIFGRWCYENCSTSGVIGDDKYFLMEVWAKNQDAGDIYAQVNLLDVADTVVGWTNDTLYLSKGSKGVLTFTTHQENVTTARLVKFSTKG